jgi:hypothetical protein
MMSRQVTSLSIVAFLVLSAVAARGDDNASVSRAEFQKLKDDVARLEQKIDSLKPPSVAPAHAPTTESKPYLAMSPINPPSGRIDITSEPKIPPIPVDAITNPTGGSSAVSTNPSKSSAGQDGTAAKRLTLEDRVKALEESSREQSTMTKDVVDWVRVVSGPKVLHSLGSTDGSTPPVTVQQFGQLRIQNRMNSDQRIVVNGTDLYTVEGKGTRVITVPVGTVTTQIRGEAPISWFLGPQNYLQEIIIAPAIRNPLTSTADRVLQYDPVSNTWFSVVP